MPILLDAESEPGLPAALANEAAITRLVGASCWSRCRRRGFKATRGVSAASVRSGDIACRYGGEELLLVLPDCDSSNAKTRLEHLCKEIREKSFLFRGKALPSVTLSVGLAQLSEDHRGRRTSAGCPA